MNEAGGACQMELLKRVLGVLVLQDHQNDLQDHQKDLQDHQNDLQDPPN